MVLTLFLGLFLLASQAHAAKPIAKISSFKGDVVIVSGKKILKATRTGQPLKTGDRVQTRDGEAQITFNDGAVLKVRPYASTMIQEREEKKGWWIFKTKKAVRRITCFVGTLWFKSGASKRKNYVQTPTAVCGLRGSAITLQFTGTDTGYNLEAGSVDVLGKAIAKLFADLGKEQSLENTVFKAINDAYNADQAAKESKTVVDAAGAKVALLEAIEATLDALKDSPDSGVKKEASAALEKVQKDLADAKKEQEDAEKAEKKAKDDKKPIPTTEATTTTETPTTTSTEGPPTTTITFPTTTTTEEDTSSSTSTTCSGY